MSERQNVRAGADHSHRVTVLLVEGSEVLRDRLLRLLGTIPGATVVEANGASGALAFLAKRRVDAVVADIDLPGWTDLEDLFQIRLAMGSAILIVLASDASPETIEFTRRVRADFFFQTHREFARIGDILLDLPARPLAQLASTGAAVLDEEFPMDQPDRRKDP